MAVNDNLPEEYRHLDGTPLQRADEFRWTRIGSPFELKSFYESRLPAIRDAAKQCGYAIAVHGSLQRDFDLIAVPWKTEHSDAQYLCKAIHMAACGAVQEAYQICTDKPCGRLTTMFPICWIEYPDAPKNGTGHVDLSIVQDLAALSSKADECDAYFETLQAICEKIGYTEEVARAGEPFVGKKVSDGIALLFNQRTVNYKLLEQFRRQVKIMLSCADGDMGIILDVLCRKLNELEILQAANQRANALIGAQAEENDRTCLALRKQVEVLDWLEEVKPLILSPIPETNPLHSLGLPDWTIEMRDKKRYNGKTLIEAATAAIQAQV